jgi:type IV secretory pathway VirB4 component
MVIGQSGSGKTVLEMALLAMSQKFNQPATPASYVLFDKDLGASIGVRAMGGKYYTVKNGVPSGNTFANQHEIWGLVIIRQGLLWHGIRGIQR